MSFERIAWTLIMPVASLLAAGAVLAFFAGVLFTGP